LPTSYRTGFPYTTLFRSGVRRVIGLRLARHRVGAHQAHHHRHRRRTRRAVVGLAIGLRGNRERLGTDHPGPIRHRRHRIVAAAVPDDHTTELHTHLVPDA